MVENQAGVTALVTAYVRAYHAVHSEPKIFDDFLAGQLFSAEEHVQFNHNLTQMLPLIAPELAAQNPTTEQAMNYVVEVHNGPITLSRSAYTEACLQQALQGGLNQYVILGAGMDTFAFRYGQSEPSVAVFEVDHPATQALKRRRVTDAGWVMPQNLHFIPVDFANQSLSEALHVSAYRPDQAAFFSWLGVSYYLSPAVVSATLREIAALAAPGSELVFDYLDAEAFMPDRVDKKVQFMQWIASQVGEPMKAGFEPDALAALLDASGFNLREDLSPAEIESRYFSGRQDAYHAFAHVHFARAVVR